jgi:ParB-like chromosome segregation protein Spo0J
MKIESRIARTGPIRWREIGWLQPDNLKEMSRADFEKLKGSIKANGFAAPFFVWDTEPPVILDGVHRRRAMLELEAEGWEIPDELPANFVECKNRKKAVKLVLVYSSIYARVTEESLYELLTTEELDFSELKQEIELPNIVMDFVENDFGEPPESVMQNVSELSEIRAARREGNAEVIKKTDTERYLVIVYPNRQEREKAVRKLGLPSDERYVPSESVEISRAETPKIIRDGKKDLKTAAPEKAGATG